MYHQVYDCCRYQQNIQIITNLRCKKRIFNFYLNLCEGDQNQASKVVLFNFFQKAVEVTVIVFLIIRCFARWSTGVIRY